MINAKGSMSVSFKRKARALTAALLLLAATSPGAWAGAAMAQIQTPGFYRMMLGEFEITALSDGVFDLNAIDMLTNTNEDELRAMLSASHHGGSVPTSVNAFVINTGAALILVDTGAATLFGPTLGKLPANLVASGYRPEQIDVILITHM
ncbi:MAG: MBL fold metallo-hydrolase, partial [Oxalobacteraceae bacterium]